MADIDTIQLSYEKPQVGDRVCLDEDLPMRSRGEKDRPPKGACGIVKGYVDASTIIVDFGDYFGDHEVLLNFESWRYEIGKSPITREQAVEAAMQLRIDPRVIPYATWFVALQIELEHGNVDSQTNVTNDDVLETAKIALAHLKEDPLFYYKNLVDMERESEAYYDEQGFKPSATLDEMFNMDVNVEQWVEWANENGYGP